MNPHAKQSNLRDHGLLRTRIGMQTTKYATSIRIYKSHSWGILIASLISNFPLLFNNGIYWDDWSLYNMSLEGIKEAFVGNGLWNSGWGWIHYALTRLPQPALWYGWITFVAVTLTALLFFKSLVFFRFIAQKSAFLLALLFIMLPFNAAKDTMICLPYTISLLLFFAGFYLFLKYLFEGKTICKYLSIPLFLYSFITNSLVLFYLVVPSVLIWFYKPGRNVMGLIDLLKKEFAILVLPVVFWGARIILLNPSNYCASNNYNELSTSRLLALPIQLLKVSIESFSGLARQLFESRFFSLYGILLLASLAAYIVVPKFRQWLSNFEMQPIKNGAVIGAVLFFVAAIPYILVGKPPSFQGFETRHQLLLPVGTSFLVYAAIQRLIVKEHRCLVLGIILSGFWIISVNNQSKFLVGWMKLEAVFQNAIAVEALKITNTIYVTDKAEDYNATERGLTFYEWNGISKLAFNRQDKLYASKDFTQDLIKRTLSKEIDFRREQHALASRNMGDYVPGGNCISLTILKTEKDLSSPSNWLPLVTQYYFSKEDFAANIKSFITLNIDENCPPNLEEFGN